MEIIWKVRALRDREAIHAATARVSLTHAFETIATIQRAVNRLEHYPYLGRQLPDQPAYRVLVVPRTHYSVAYRLIARGTHPRVEILRILDQRGNR